MKFAFLSSYAHRALDPACGEVSGGAELQIALLGRELAARGHEVTLLSGDEGQTEERLLQGVRSVTTGRFQTGAATDTLFALPAVWKGLKAVRPDYVGVLGWTSWLYFLHLMKPALGYRLVFICGLDTEVNGVFRKENPVRGRLFERGMHRADYRFAMSELQQRLFHEQGLDCGFYRNLILERDAPPAGEKTIDLLWIARCRPIKQPERFLDLAEALPEARCRMIAPPEDRDLFARIQGRAAGLPNLELIPGVPYREIQAHYDAARIFVNTSRFEGFPNSFIQAGQGRTAIVSLAVDSDQLLERFGAGRFAAGDFGRLVEEVRELLRNAEALGAAATGAERFVREWHSNARNVDAFLEGLEPGRPLR